MEGAIANDEVDGVLWEERASALVVGGSVLVEVRDSIEVCVRGGGEESKMEDRLLPPGARRKMGAAYAREKKIGVDDGAMRAPSPEVVDARHTSGKREAVWEGAVGYGWKWKV